MIDLLKNNKNSFKDKKTDFQNDAISSDEELTDSQQPESNKDSAPVKQKIDLGAYKDPEGLTIKKLNIGLWLVKNRKNIYLLFFSFLIMVSIVAWSIFLLNFGMYIVSGMNKDQGMVSSLVKESLIGQKYLEEISAVDLKYGQVQAIKTLEGNYDIFTNIENLNSRHFLEFDYYFMAGDEKIEGGTSFVLPRQAKYLLSLNKKINSSPRNISFHIENLKWKRINRHTYPDWDDFRNRRLAITTSEIEFIPANANKLTEKLDLNNLNFKAANNTAFNYKEVNFVILLYSGGKIIGANKYILNNFMSEQTQNVNLVWPGKLDRVNEVVIYPEVNIVDNSLYLDFDGGSGELK